MEAWLKTKDKAFKFPIIPHEHPVEHSYRVETENLVNGDQVSMYAGNNLKTFSLDGHFPHDSDRAYLPDIIDKWECVRQVEEIAKSQAEIRYIVTTTEINHPVKITNFNYKMADGSQDIYFSLDMIEHRPPKVLEWEPPKTQAELKEEAKKVKPTGENRYENRPSVHNPELNRKDDKASTGNKKVHVVVKGDNMWDIANKYYKDGSQHKKIRNYPENQKNYPKLKESNVIYVGWKLVIP